MKVVRAAALSRRRAPTFTLIGRRETVQLRKCNWLTRCLFWELAGLASFTTGCGKTSYAVLIALLSYDVAPQSHDTGIATLRRIRDAFSDLVELGLVTVDAKRNEDEGGLFFDLKPRAGIIPSADMKGRGEGQGSSPMRNSEKAGVRDRDEGQGVQERKRINNSPTPQAELAPGKPSRTVLEMRRRLRPARPRGVLK